MVETYARWVGRILLESVALLAFGVFMMMPALVSYDFLKFRKVREAMRTELSALTPSERAPSAAVAAVFKEQGSKAGELSSLVAWRLCLKLCSDVADFDTRWEKRLEPAFLWPTMLRLSFSDQEILGKNETGDGGQRHGRGAHT